MNPEKADGRIILQLRDAVILKRLSLVLLDQVEAGPVVRGKERGAHHMGAGFHRKSDFEGPIGFPHPLTQTNANVIE